MLVDTASQYGVGSIYFLAGWLKLVNIGYGSFALLDGILTGLLFVAGYLLLRLAGGPRPLAMGTLGVAVVALVYNRAYPVGALPQEGPFRFGLPMVVVLATVAGARWPRWRGAARGVTIGALAVSSLWALEAFAYTALTFVALVCAEAYLGEPRGRLAVGGPPGADRPGCVRGRPSGIRPGHVARHRPAPGLGPVHRLHPCVPARGPGRHHLRLLPLVGRTRGGRRLSGRGRAAAHRPAPLSHLRPARERRHARTHRPDRVRGGAVRVLHRPLSRPRAGVRRPPAGADRRPLAQSRLEPGPDRTPAGCALGGARGGARARAPGHFGGVVVDRIALRRLRARSRGARRTLRAGQQSPGCAPSRRSTPRHRRGRDCSSVTCPASAARTCSWTRTWRPRP